MADVERRSSGISAFRVSEIVGFGLALVVFVLGALMLAFALVRVLTGQAIMFGNTDPVFQFVVGFVIINVGAVMMDRIMRDHSRYIS